MTERPWPFLAVAAALLLAGGGKAVVDTDPTLEPVAAALIAGGLITLGAWIAAEIRKGNDE